MLVHLFYVYFCARARVGEDIHRADILFEDLFTLPIGGHGFK
jgi:hypothetical protein